MNATVNAAHVAETILVQLGGRRFITMTGAKSLTHTADSLTFRLPGNGFAKSGITCVVVTLNADDLYDVQFWSIRGAKAKVVAEFSGVFAESLRELFSSTTGLRTSL